MSMKVKVLKAPLLIDDAYGNTLDVSRKKFEKDPDAVYTVPSGPFWMDRVKWGYIGIVEMTTDKPKKEAPKPKE